MSEWLWDVLPVLVVFIGTFGMSMSAALMNYFGETTPEARALNPTDHRSVMWSALIGSLCFGAFVGGIAFVVLKPHFADTVVFLSICELIALYFMGTLYGAAVRRVRDS